MRTTIIPAQITTVEDKIAGNLNFTQIMLLMIPVFWTVLVYVCLSPRMKLSWYKFPLVITVLAVCLILSLRIKGKVVLNWLIVLLRFNLRPGFYVFNKNETYLRTLDLPVIEKPSPKLLQNKAKARKEKPAAAEIGEKELVKLENLINRKGASLSFKLGKGGGLNVAFEQVKN
jgi:hypothetical protein